MSIFKAWSRLPEALTYEGYEFRLILRGPFVGYFLTGCHSKKRDKRQAFKNGVWTDKNVSKHLSSVGSDYFIKVLMWTDEDLGKALTKLQHELIQMGFMANETKTPVEDADYELIPFHQLN